MDIRLLQQVNAKALSTLQASIRDLPAAQRLRQSFVRPTVTYRLWQVHGTVAHLAACIAILLLGKVGMLNSARAIQQSASRAMNQYYAKVVGQEMADRIFPTF